MTVSQRTHSQAILEQLQIKSYCSSVAQLKQPRNPHRTATDTPEDNSSLQRNNQWANLVVETYPRGLKGTSTKNRNTW